MAAASEGRSSSTDASPGVVGQALVDFALHGSFPEEDVSSLKVKPDQLAPAMTALAGAKKALEAEIRTINADTAPDVQTWVTNAKALEDDLNRSKALANEIIRQAEAPDVSGQTILEAEERVEFLIREVRYNRQVLDVLTALQNVSRLLDQVEQARLERRIVDSLNLIQQSWTAIDNIPVSKSVRAMKLLEMRAYELQSDAHEVFDHVWRALVNIDKDKRKIVIHASRDDEAMTILDAVVGLKAYKELDKRMAQLWHDIDSVIIGPRIDIELEPLPGVRVDKGAIYLSGRADRTIKSLFADLQQIILYLTQQLPPELTVSLSQAMMPELMARVITVWLNSAVPASLKKMGEFQEVIESSKVFCSSLKESSFYSCDELQEWVDNAPKVWLAKCRETALDMIRYNLSQGLGNPTQVERIETHMVTREEGKELAANGATGDNQDWDSAWSDAEGAGGAAGNEQPASSTEAKEDDGTDAWGWGEEGEEEDKAKGEGEGQEEEAAKADDSSTAEDDSADAWGWGDDQAAEPAADLDAPDPKAAAAGGSKEAEPQTREITVKEIYSISSMPDPVISLVSAILEDGATLTREGSEDNPVAAAAAGLFSLPTFALALFRALSPYYYDLDIGGKMYLYNDTMYLAEKLADFATSWKSRNDLSSRAQNMLRLDNDIEALKSFAIRSYSNEMNTQKTVLRDLLGGAQNLLQRDGLDFDDVEASIDAAVSRVRTLAAAWDSVLAKSAWYQAVGALADTIASKLVADVLDLPSIGQDEAYNIARVIARVTELDDLFVVPSSATAPIPQTARYATSWLRLKYLSEVLQSNLRDVRYLWLESELSLYFTVDEVVDLIGLSFEQNPRTREVVRDIQHNPRPLGDPDSDFA